MRKALVALVICLAMLISAEAQYSASPNDYLFCDTGDTTNDSTAAIWGQDLLSHGWQTLNSAYKKFIYVGDGHVKGNTSFFYNMSDGFRSRRHADIGVPRNNLTLQAMYYDTGEIPTSAYLVAYNGETTRVYVGVDSTDSEHYDEYWVQDVGNSEYIDYYVGKRTIGWHTFTIYVDTKGVETYIDGSLVKIINRTITADRILIGTDGGNSVYFDEAFIWEGKPNDRPSTPCRQKILCTDECSPSGTKTCSGAGYLTCGNYDSDTCLEWGSVTDCSPGESCESGECVVPDSDNDGVPDADDQCSDTLLPDGVPEKNLKPNHYADVDGDGIFEVTVPKSKTKAIVDSVYTLADTRGCTCEQILAIKEGNNLGEKMYGCSSGTMSEFVAGADWAYNEPEEDGGNSPIGWVIGIWGIFG